MMLPPKVSRSAMAAQRRRIGEGPGPTGEGLVGRYRDRVLPLALGEDLEQQFGAPPVQLHVVHTVEVSTAKMRREWCPHVFLPRQHPCPPLGNARCRAEVGNVAATSAFSTDRSAWLAGVSGWPRADEPFEGNSPADGNFLLSAGDTLSVDCDTCREAVSARLDGEAEPVPVEETDAHLDSCAACRQWQHDAAALTRSVRLRPAVEVPDLAEDVLAAAPPVTPVARATRGWYWRMGLAGVAVAQLTLGLAQVFGVGTGHAVPEHAGGEQVSTHLFNESTAWNLALGLGMLWTALRPRATSGMLSVTAAFVAVLVPFSVNDLVSGAAPLSRITSHVFLVLGLVLLAAVHRVHRAPEDGTPATGVPGGPRVDVDDDSDTGPEQRPDADGGWRHLRPVSRKRAA
jgi:predicted anti-sigma-YlaC factor YlaD